jgi:hypothetical protein
VLVFLDVLFKHEDEWHACEVKSSKRISDTYMLDAALQYYVITNSGINIDKFYIAHINEEYVLEDELDINSLFKLVDVSEKIRLRQSYVKEQIEREKATLELTSSPKIDVGPHCHDPYPCDFIGHCWKNIEKEVISIDYDISEIRKVVDAIDGNLAFLHLSSFRPAIPIFKGTRPYQEIPFQYSLTEKDGNVHSYMLPLGEHPDLLYGHLRDALKGFDVIITDARYQMPDAGRTGKVFNLHDYYENLPLDELAKQLLDDTSMEKLSLGKDILVADAYNDMVHGNEDPELIQAIKEYGEHSAKILRKIFEA